MGGDFGAEKDLGLSKALDLSKKKNGLVTEILKITEDAIFTCDPDILNAESELFVELYGKRVAMIDELKEIQALLSPLLSSLLEQSASAELARLESHSEIVLKKIITLDKRNIGIGAALSDGIKENIKKINRGRDVSLKYNQSMNDTGGRAFDEKN